MCGIAGAYSLGGELPPQVVAGVSRMRVALHHRGPDASGMWTSPDGRTALAATRLAIRDLSRAANQPFTSIRGATVYNGELYDWTAAMLERGRTRTSGDTEIIHELTCADPLLLMQVSGMYAVATWRAATRSLVLARDPAGEKPLYIARHDHWIAFASELRALIEAGLLSPKVDRDALAMLLRLGNVPEPLCIYAGARPLDAGTILEIHSDGRETSNSWWPEPSRDISLIRPAEVRNTVIDAVGRATVSDVPIGIFLSGGIDSSVIAAAAHAAGSDLSALTLTSPRGSVDESAAAAATARHLGMSHQIVMVNPNDALVTLPEFFRIMDQPTVNGFNSYLICKAGRSAGLTVALSGVGGDELFRGYPSFPLLARARRLRQTRAPTPLVLLGARALGLRHERGVDLIRARNSLEAYVALRGVLGINRTERLLGSHVNWRSLLGRLGVGAPGETGDRETSLLEARGYMRNQLLRDIDIFSMGCSLEVRSPLLSPNVISIAGALPNDRRLRGKQLLKDAFRADLPPDLLARSKQGFSLPWEHWLHTSLRQFARDSLDNLSRSQGLIDPEEASRALTDFEHGRLHWSGVWVLAALCQWAAVHSDAGVILN